jgi:LmbE family N-acetylglucosaminyl deacetylase
MSFEFNRPLILVAHPDDETLACGGLLQRIDSSLVVFATDGAPPYYNFERKFGSLKEYSDARFQEAARALAHVPNCSFQRLPGPDGSHFVDQQLFRDLRPALNSFCQIARTFSPDALLSHAYEGGHIDHDACSFIASHAATALSLKLFEFPLYSMDESGRAILQKFRDAGSAPAEWSLTPTEIACKQKMLAEYRTQPGLASAFSLISERIRLSGHIDFTLPACRDYTYRSRWRRSGRLRAKTLLKEFAKFEAGGTDFLG